MRASRPHNSRRSVSSKKKKSSRGSGPSTNQSLISDYFSPPSALSWSAEDGEGRSVPLNGEQRGVLDIVVNQGKSVFFTGAAGTGKSLLLRAIIAAFKEKHAKQPAVVSVTASTGMAASNIGGMTIHSWGAVAPNKFDLEKQIKSVRSCRPAYARWTTTKVLIIDEVSMVDGHLFSLLSSIADRLRNAGPGRPFGGIQLVVTGDFFQLPPVTEAGAEPSFAFESPQWKACIERTVYLKDVFRQADNSFVDILNSLRVGIVTSAAYRAFNLLSRELLPTDGIVPTELFPRKKQVLDANRVKLDAIPGESSLYSSRDSGKGSEVKTMLQNVTAHEKVELKVGAQVMLIKNLDQYLVNGSVGRVLGFYPASAVSGQGTISANGGNGVIREVLLDKGELKPVEKDLTVSEAGERPRSTETFPLVVFPVPSGKEAVLMGRLAFKVEDADGTVVASRAQIPLVLAWAMSIHKSQGQTLKYVKVDLSGVFEKGQTYVALSRASSLEGLQVVHFDAGKVKAHPKVIDWHRELEMQEEQDAEGS